MHFLSNAKSTVTSISLLLLLGVGACQEPIPLDQNTAQANESNTLNDGTTSSVDTTGNVGDTEEAVRIGILTIDSALSVHNRYAPLADYLSETLERPFELIALTQESQFTAVEADEIDFIATNSLAAVQVQRLYKTEFLVTHSRPRSGTQFSALVIARSDSDIQSLDDLRGKRVACVDVETAAAGCLFQIYHLQQDNIDAFQDFGELIENPSQDNIVFAVLNGTIDAGFIRTGQLEKMLRNELLTSLDEIKILDQADDTFVYAHTTALYPEWPIAALRNTDPILSDAVETALLTIPDDHPALASANVESFVDAVDYQSINDLIETLQLKSWDAD